MKKLLIVSLSLLVMAFGGFVEGLEDLPKPESWQQIEDETISFGNQETNFVELYLESKNESFQDLIEFYKSTLPQLGWKFEDKNDKPNTFIREKEILVIENIDKKARITLKSSN